MVPNNNDVTIDTEEVDFDEMPDLEEKDGDNTDSDEDEDNEYD